MIYNMLPQAGGDLPKGVIVMWSGAVDAVPDGWAICDGTNGTPDLRGRFVLGAGGTHAVGNTGGEERHTLTVSEMPAHSHNFLAQSRVYVDTHVPCAGLGGDDPSHTSARAFPDTYSTGGSQPHNNMPPYYALAYIMKL